MKKLLIALFILLILLACGLLFSSGTYLGNSVGYEEVKGFGNNGVPPTGGTCENAGEFNDENPFHGWPAEFHDCDWHVISAYYCSPSYYRAIGAVHWGMDFSNYSDPNLGVWEAIAGVPVRATIDYGLVKQAVYSNPPQWNYGMGNFVQIVSLEPICEMDVAEDLDGDGIIGEYCGVACEEELDVDLNGDGEITNYCGEESPWRATYMHLVDVTVSAGQMVRWGDIVGHVGTTGHSSGVHLHYQINGPEGPIDPGPHLDCPDYEWDRGVREGK